MDIKIDINSKELDNKIKELNTKSKDLKPLFNEIGKIIQSKTQDSFNTQSSPSGETWQPLKPKTIKLKTKRGKGKSILEYEGNMFAKDRPLYKANSSSVIVGFDAKSDNGSYPYPAVHQFGSKDGTIPKRPFLPVDDGGKKLNEEVKGEILEMVRGWLLK